MSNFTESEILAEIQRRRSRSEEAHLPFWRNKIGEQGFPGLPVKWSRYIPDIPTSKQLAALLVDDHQEVLFGGSAGSGKSKWLLMAALQWADHPQFNGIIFRRKLTDIKRSGLFRTLFDWLAPHRGVWFDDDICRFYFPEGGSLGFGYFDSLYDYESFQGGEYSFIGVDELDQWIEAWYEKLFDRNRKTVDNPIPLRMRVATNPGGYGHAWIKKRFKIELNPTTKLYQGYHPTRIVIPAYPWDNPYIDIESYVRSLVHVDPLRREQMLMGNWMIADEGRIKSAWFQNRRYSTRGGYLFLDPECKTKPYMLNQVRFFQTIDPAASSREGPADAKQATSSRQPSYTVISTWFVVGRVLGLWHVERFRDEIPVVVERIRANYLQRISEGLNLTEIGCENVGPGLGVFQLLAQMRLPVVALPAKGDKVQRSADFSNRASQGFVYLPDPLDVQAGNWLSDWETEVFQWTGHPSETDDQVDTASNAAIMTSQQFSCGVQDVFSESATAELIPSTFGNMYRG